MSLLDIDITCENVLQDVLLNRIREHYQKVINRKIKIISVTQFDILGCNMGFIDWDEIFDHSDEWYVYYYMGVDTNWDMRVKFTPYKIPHVSGGRMVKEFIDGNIKPRYLL